MKTTDDTKALMVKVESLRAEVAAIRDAAQAIRSLGIREEVIITLIRLSSNPVKVGRTSKRPTRDMIQSVIGGMESLEEYVFGDKKEPGK